MSAALFFVSMCNRFVTSISLRIFWTRLPTYIFRRVMSDLAQAMATVESENKIVSLIGNGKAFWTETINWASSSKLDNSSLGIVVLAIGAIRDLEQSKRQKVSFEVTDRTYTAAPYAFCEASQNPISWIDSVLSNDRTQRSKTTSGMLCSCDLNFIHFSAATAGRGVSQSNSFIFHKSCIMDLAVTVRGPTRPMGSKSFAASENMVRFVGVWG